MPVKITVTVPQAQALFNLVEKAKQWRVTNKDRKDLEDNEAELVEAVEWWESQELKEARPNAS